MRTKQPPAFGANADERESCVPQKLQNPVEEKVKR